MHNEPDTEAFEYEQSAAKRKKRITVSFVPVWIAMILAVAAIVVMVAVAAKERRENKPGVMEAAYVGHSPAREFARDVPVKAPLKFNHVIFRLGDEEIFRFAYEDAGDGRRYSFEVREGGS